MQIAAFFDFDGTLYNGHLWHDISGYYRQRGERRALVWGYLITHLALWPLNRLRLLSDERFYTLWARDLCWLLRGLTAAGATAILRQIYERRVRPNLRAEVLARLRWHQEQGHLVFLVSGAFVELLGMLAAELGVPYVVGTVPEVRQGRYTGRAAGPAVTGRGKVQAIERLAREQGLELAWPASYAYGDGGTDLPLLSRVGHPVAVHPDRVLAAQARQRGWEVLGGAGA